MKNKFLKYSLSIGFVLFVLACSVKKDKFVNRSFHSVTTEYNILYNGNIALDEGVQNLISTYTDNFWEILPVEQMPDDEENFLPGQAKNPSFERAEEKAVKAIQKHSMNIGGTERNPQMDEAYLLLAKSRYYDNRFIPSLEALNYILYKYPKSDKIYHAKVWREKVNIRIDNNEVAIENLKKLLKNNQIEGQDLADANAMLAQAYMNTGSNDSAIACIKVAKVETKVKEQRARYSFILGQLYETMQYNDSAFVAFQDVIDMKRKAPRRYVIQAHAKQAAQFDYKKGDTLLFVEKFNSLLADRENRPYLDILNHQMGLFYDKNKMPKRAEKYYNTSLRANSQDPYLISSNYRNIGEIYFKDAEYKTAGKYYDSTLLRLTPRTREFRRIKKKRDNLDDVILYEDIAHENDSILLVLNMSDNERDIYYQKYIDKIKIEDEEKAKIAAELKEKEELNNNPNGADPLPGPGGKKGAPPGFLPPSNFGNQQSTFYFYNPLTVNYGIKEFQKKWGKRELKANWRFSKKKNSSFNSVEEEVEELVNDSLPEKIEDPRYTIAYYTEKLPTTSEAKDSIAKDRNFAYYQLGLIYKEKFKEYELAASRLEQLLKNQPEERLVLPAKYNLYKIYEIIDPAKANIYKNDIVTNYPDSRYAQIVLHPEIALTDNENPDIVYDKLYKLYQSDSIRAAFEEVNLRVEQYLGDESLPRFEMLKASITGRLQGLAAYKEALTYVSLTYPNEPEGKAAESVLQNDIPKLEMLKINPKEGSSWKMVFKRDHANNENKDKLIEKLQLYLKDRHNDDLKLSIDVYNSNQDFIVVHGFITKETALATLSVLREFKDYKIKEEAFVVSTEDYKVIQIKKEFENWITLNKE